MADGTGSGLREERTGGAGREWGAVLLRLLAALAVVAAVYVGAALYFQDRPPAGLSVAGVDIGSLSRDEAVAHLERELADQESAPVMVPVQAVDGAGSPVGEPEEISLVPVEAGLSYDYDATLEGVTGFTLDPRTLWSHVARTERELPLRGAVDQEALTAAVTALAEGYDREPVEGEVELVDGKVEVVDAQEGRTLPVETVVGAVEEAWPQHPEGLTVEAASVPPFLTRAEVERFTTEEVEPAIAAPLVVTAVDGQGEEAKKATAEVPQREIAALLTVDRAEDHTLTLQVDEDALLDRLRQDLGQLERGPSDATVRLDGDDVEVVPAKNGAALDEEEMMTSVLAALRKSGDERTVSTELQVVEPAIPTAASEGWTFRPMGSFVSEFPVGVANEARTHNIHTGIDHVNGTVVMPGEQFSLGATLSPITIEGGYREAPVIHDGRLVMGTGGGLSQVSTTVFNTAWFSGVQLDAHTPHSFYIPRYPAGREATISYPGLDNLWTNDTDTPIVVRSWITGNQIHMEFLGERQYDVETIEGPRQNLRDGQRIVDDSPQCVTQVASPGFTIYVARVLSKDGVVAGRDEFTTTYIPEDEVVCTHPEAS